MLLYSLPYPVEAFHPCFVGFSIPLPLGEHELDELYEAPCILHMSLLTAYYVANLGD
jgi:hypothetical protein